MALDLSPLFRATVGFDHLNRMLSELTDNQLPAYPPYNIVKMGAYLYRITMALAGFESSDINIVLNEGVLVVSSSGPSEPKNTEYLHKGIATRGFERRFQLAEYIKVGNANMDNGLLHIDLERELPENKKPRTIKNRTSSPDNFVK